jgi:hypothetical protein
MMYFDNRVTALRHYITLFYYDFDMVLKKKEFAILEATFF